MSKCEFENFLKNFLFFFYNLPFPNLADRRGGSFCGESWNRIRRAFPGWNADNVNRVQWCHRQKAGGEDYDLRWKDRSGAEIRASDGGGSVNRIWIWEDTRSRFQELEALIQEKNDTREILTNFINKLEDLTGKQTEFREELWGGLVDHIRIDEKSSTVVFRGGIEITI